MQNTVTATVVKPKVALVIKPLIPATRFEGKFSRGVKYY